MRSEATFAGVVRKVVGARVSVELSQDLSASPIIEGRIHRIGQVGSFVRIPLGFLSLYGVVSMVGASEALEPTEAGVPLGRGQRWIEVQLLGEAYRSEDFNRGVSVFPTLDDEVHVVTEADLSLIYAHGKPSMIQMGTLATSNSVPAYVDLDRLVTRHAAILGSTGSGKSNMVAGLLKGLVSGGYPSAQVLVIDPHGEYGSALQESARVFSIGEENNPLVVPYWALSFDELGWFLVDRKGATESTADMALREKIYEGRKSKCDGLRAGNLEPDEITPDSPVPFDLRQLWYDAYVEEHATLRAKDDWNQIAYRKGADGADIKGSAKDVIPPQFEPPNPGGAAPFRSTRARGLGAYLNRIQNRVGDKNFEFLLSPGNYDGTTSDLNDLLTGWLGHEHGLTVLDLSGVPSEVLDLVVGVVTRIVFEGMFWGRTLPGMGKQRPLLLVYEEAHLYLPRGGTGQFVAGYSSRAVRRVFKEGRKYGVGAIVVSQRPSELDETVLSQCGTFFAMRLSNSDDQGRIKSVVPDSLVGLVEMLPALRTGEAMVLGEAVQIPTRVRLPLVEPRPRSDDPEPTKRWSQERVAAPPYGTAVTSWRRQRTSK